RTVGLLSCHASCWVVGALLPRMRQQLVLAVDNRKISSYKLLSMVRRRPHALLPLEGAILDTAAGLRRAGAGPTHGYALAAQLREARGARRLTSHGTLYKALTRLERAGLLTSHWEDADDATREGRPRRRLYEI